MSRFSLYSVCCPEHGEIQQTLGFLNQVPEFDEECWVVDMTGQHCRRRLTAYLVDRIP